MSPGTVERVVALAVIVGAAVPPAAAQEVCDLGPAYAAAVFSCVGGPAHGAPCSGWGDPVCVGGSCQLGAGGSATWYDYSGQGACGLGALDPGELVTAVALPDWAGSAMCGRCLEVEGPLATITVKVVDRCPECGPGHVDLDDQAFAAIADPGLGHVPVAWRTVACDVAGNVTLTSSDGVNPWWYAAYVDHHRHGVASVELHDADAPDWTAAVRQDWNTWVVQDSAGMVLPLSVRVTDVVGGAVEADGVVTDLLGGSVFDLGAQLPVCEVVLFADGFESGAVGGWSSAVP